MKVGSSLLPLKTIGQTVKTRDLPEEFLRPTVPVMQFVYRFRDTLGILDCVRALQIKSLRMQVRIDLGRAVIPQ